MPKPVTVTRGNNPIDEFWFPGFIFLLLFNQENCISFLLYKTVYEHWQDGYKKNYKQQNPTLKGNINETMDLMSFVSPIQFHSTNDIINLKGTN